MTSPQATRRDRSYNIILLSDGTGNGAASLFKTNVRRLFEALDLTDPKNPADPRQFAFYDDGVGTSPLRPLAALGGAFGYGLARNVRELYANLCRVWQEGDRIYVFGFSRGAFTARILTGLILNQGLVPYTGDEAELDRRVTQAYRDYRTQRYRRRHLPLLRLSDAYYATKDACFGQGYRREDNRGHPDGPNPMHVQFLGVWDAVDAYGLPIDELTLAVDSLLWPLTMTDATLNPNVQRACQALGLDDERRTFHPRLWNEATEKEPTRTPRKDGQEAVTERITQVWFTGVHADIGGGYPDGGLAHVTLDWMVRHAEAHGLRFLEPIRSQQRALSDENGLLHDSRRGLAAYYRYMPRRVAALSHQRKALTGRPDVTVARPKIHESVFRRMSVGGDGYVPIGLPETFDVVRVSEEAYPAGDRVEYVTDGEAYLAEAQRAGSPGPPPPAPSGQRVDRQEDLWTWVWWRRVAYFVTLFATLGLVMMPLIFTGTACVSWACFGEIPVLVGAGAILPGFLDPWIRSFANNPQTFGVLALLVVLGMLAGRRLETRLRDDARRFWYGMVPTLRPGHVPPVKAPDRQQGLGAAIRRMRLSEPYRRSWMALARYILPGAAFVVAAWGFLGLGNLGVMTVRDTFGIGCNAPKDAAPASSFRPSDPCAFITRVDAGTRYRVTVTVLGAFHDDTIAASPHGNAPSAMDTLFWIATPFRRHPGQPMFRLMARIGERGSTTFAPDWEQDPNNRNRFRAEFRAPRGGPLFLYVNEVTPAFWPTAFYGNNRGIATVAVTPQGRFAP